MLLPYIVSFLKTAFLILVSVFCVRGLLHVSENPLLPKGPKSQLEFLSRTLLLCMSVSGDLTWFLCWRTCGVSYLAPSSWKDYIL